jgi:uncharacterized protein
MQINWNEFSPIASFAGGLLIGLSAALLLLLNGRVAGISGIIRQAIFASNKEMTWRLSFILGMLISPSIYFVLFPYAPIQIHDNVTLLIIAGVLVGYGTSMGAGCTSGHGICGLSRLSLRSLTAVVLFMSAAMLTTFLVKHF